ncbi:PEP-CTERM sorting domain-containing protein [Thalassotalea piscium]
MRLITKIAITSLLSLQLISSAFAGLINVDYTINASVGNPISSNDFPLSGTESVIAGQEFTQNSSLVFESSGFPQTFVGNVGFDLTSDTITVMFNGTGQGVDLTFNFSNLVWDTPTILTGLTLVSQSCSADIYSCNGVADYSIPTFSGNSISSMGLRMFGFQPGMNFSQTYQLITKEDTSVPPAPVDVPEPLTVVMLAFGLLGFAARRLSK